MEQNEKIDRLNFLKKLGFGGASLMAVYLGACKSSTSTTPDPVTQFTLDMSTTTYAKLKTVGQYVTVNNVVVACISAGTYAAVTQVCSHEGLKQVVYNGTNFFCGAHNALFSTTGKGLNPPEAEALQRIR